MVLLLDGWGGSWGSDAGGALVADTWALTWTYDVDLQPATSAGAAGHTGRGARAGRFFAYPNIIDDGNLRFLPPTPKVAPRKAKKKVDDEPPDENDPDIRRMRSAMDYRMANPAPPSDPTEDQDMVRVAEMIRRRLNKQ